MKQQVLNKQDWTTARVILRNSYAINDTWREVIEKFRQRINNYYFEPIEKVKVGNKLKGEGFTILTIQCALIEMFAAFKVGKIHNHSKHGNLPAFEYKKADDCFIPFLHSEAIFENHFFIRDNITNQKQPNQPFNANHFYDKVRCGLMHEARTKEEWVVNAKTTYLETESIFIELKTTTGQISIDRNILNKQIKSYFNNYLIELAADDNDGNILRRLFARKLDHLYDIPRDSVNYDWWQDRQAEN